ncbi:MAG: 3-oxoacyl-[acyl-carrier-protein] synthase III C-terminal domain-containing protein, partial [Chlamydiales bacterium]
STFYENEKSAPDDIIHVTCTGYHSPSAGQKLVAEKKWPTVVTHAYHMGCYASIPGVRMAQGFLAVGRKRVDVVHTEFCSLHLNPSMHSEEQFVGQSLFADGCIKYTLTREPQGLQLLSAREEIIPGTTEEMKWECKDWGLEMTLSKQIPIYIAQEVEGFIHRLFADVNLPYEREKCAFAIHPGGPRIISFICRMLHLDKSQIAHSKHVLKNFGNMSSATLPHIWEEVLLDKEYSSGTLVVSLAFGPGLCIAGSLLKKV